MSFHEPAIKHAVFALGALLGRMVSPGAPAFNHLLISQPSSELIYVLEHCTRALSHVREGPVWTRESRGTALALCLCFTWIELLRDNPDGAFIHVEAGAAIAQSAPRNGEAGIEPCLLHAFERVYTQARLHGSRNFAFKLPCPSMALDTEEPTETHLFEDVDEGRAGLDRIIASTATLMRHLKQSTGSTRLLGNHPSPGRPLLAQALQSQREALARWHDRWKRGCFRSPVTDRQKNDAAKSFLEIQYLKQLVILSSLDDPSEICFERHVPEFERIVDVVEDFLETTEGLGMFPLSFEAVVISPLFFTCLKCPLTSVRQRALRVLKRCPSREGLWYQDRSVEIARWKLDKEARGYSEDYCAPASVRMHSERFSLRIVNGKTTPCVSYKVGLSEDEVVEPMDAEMSLSHGANARRQNVPWTVLSSQWGDWTGSMI